VHVQALVIPVRHDGEQGLQWRAGFLDTAVLEIAPCHPLLRFDDVVHAVGEARPVLGFRLEDGFSEDRARIVEDLAHEVGNEAFGDAIAEPARQHALAVEIEIAERFHVALVDEPGCLALPGVQARPDFRHQ